MNREQFLQKLRAEQTAWEAFLASIPTGQGEQAGFYGTWSVKDIVGHAAAWERYATGRLRAIRKITWQGCASCCRDKQQYEEHSLAKPTRPQTRTLFQAEFCYCSTG